MQRKRRHGLRHAAGKGDGFGGTGGGGTCRRVAPPAPEVYLQDFGADALNLRLDFWVDLNVQSNRYRIMSDVRPQIEALFSQQGVEMAFPQRQLHLVHPLKVQWVAAESAATNQSQDKTGEETPVQR